MSGRNDLAALIFEDDRTDHPQVAVGQLDELATAIVRLTNAVALAEKLTAQPILSDIKIAANPARGSLLIYIAPQLMHQAQLAVANFNAQDAAAYLELALFAWTLLFGEKGIMAPWRKMALAKTAINPVPNELEVDVEDAGALLSDPSVVEGLEHLVIAAAATGCSRVSIKLHDAEPSLIHSSEDQIVEMILARRAPVRHGAKVGSSNAEAFSQAIYWEGRPSFYVTGPNGQLYSAKECRSGKNLFYMIFPRSARDPGAHVGALLVYAYAKADLRVVSTGEPLGPLIALPLDSALWEDPTFTRQ